MSQLLYLQKLFTFLLNTVHVVFIMHYQRTKAGPSFFKSDFKADKLFCTKSQLAANKKKEKK